MNTKEPNWAIIPRSYLLKILDRMSRFGEGVTAMRVQLGVTGGKGETSTPHFLLTDLVTGKFQIYNGISFDPFTESSTGDFDENRISEPYTAEQIRAHF